MSRTIDYGYHHPQQSEDLNLPLFLYIEEPPLPEPPEEPPNRPAFLSDPPSKREREAMAILAYLQEHAVGKENAIRGGDLAHQVGLRTTNIMQDRIQWLRMQGYLVLSTISDGYFIGATPEELEEFVEWNCLNRVVSQLDTTNAMIIRARQKWGEPAYHIDRIAIVRVPPSELPARLHD